MKLFTFAILSLVFVIACAAEDFREKVFPHLRACREELGLSPEAFRKIRRGEIFEENADDAKVFIFCDYSVHSSF